MDVKHLFAEELEKKLKDSLNFETILTMIEKPKQEDMGDLAFPCFVLAKTFRKPPKEIAEELAQDLDALWVEEAESVNGYLNIHLKRKPIAEAVLKEIATKQSSYGEANIGQGEVMTLDLSSPNIAKPFSMGHLRSTVIGNAIALIAEKCGYKPIRINHLGDWGTQFGKLIVAYQKWGDPEKVRAQPIKELLELYIKFHKEAESNSSLEDEGRKAFKDLEAGDAEALKLWKWFREESLKEFNKIYELLGVSFDAVQGEAFYNDKMAAVVKQLEEKQLLEPSEGAMVVPVGENHPPCLIKKKDGTTLYATRDLAAAIYRHQTYHFSKSLYVVGNEQTLHFQQLKVVLEKMGYEWASEMKHVPFGMMLKDGKKMSTRKGKVVLLEDVLNDAIELAKASIDEKNPELEDKGAVARQVGTGAVIFHDLKHHRMGDVEFSLEDMLKFEGNTGPYIQYTHARAASLLNKGGYTTTDVVSLNDEDEAWSIIKYLADFPEAVQRSLNDYDPSLIAKYLFDLSKAFNKYYANVRILEDPERLNVVFAIKTVLKEGLRLLGIKAPDAM
ncbi:arginine--tRNA ligase [Thalassobacillus hwangdonensis]|uniref:Arginine--tRNA ligase n=1 Tax=Thalassobacillus hwangdonensis TaxID=546108 RepID=A0ABW3KXJ2_9BACI